MNQEQLNAIKERVAKATFGPWEYDNEERGIWNSGGFNYLGTVTLSHIDAEFIANAREDVPALVAEVERLQAVYKEAVEAVDWRIKLISQLTEQSAKYLDEIERLRAELSDIIAVATEEASSISHDNGYDDIIAIARSALK